MATLAVCTSFYLKLVTSLPMKNTVFVAALKSKGLFSGDLKANMKALPTATEAAEYFLDNKIEKDLMNDNIDSFLQLLSVMDEYVDQSLNELATEIKGKLMVDSLPVSSNHSQPASVTGVTSRKRKRTLSESDVAESAQTIEFAASSAVSFARFSTVSEAFIYLTSQMMLQLTKANFCNIRRSCTEQTKTPKGAQLTSKVIEKVKLCTNVNDLFDALADSPFWNWFDLRLISAMAVASGLEESMQLLQNYKQSVFSRKVYDVIPNAPSIKVKNRYYKILVTKLKKKVGDLTVADLLEFQFKLEKVILDINVGVCTLDHVKEGCIKIHWCIPTQYVSNAYNSARKQCDRFKDFSLLYLQIENYPIICSLESNEDDRMLAQYPLVNTAIDCLYGPQVIDVIMRKPEFSFLTRSYSFLYQSLIPNCKLTIKTLKQYLEIPSDVERFIVNGENSRIRCQRIINLLLVQLDTTRDYKHFCYLFNMISVMTEKLRIDPTHQAHLNTTSSVNQLDNYAVDNIIIRCVDDGPSDDRADNYSISSHHQVIGRRRCRPVTTTTSNKLPTITTISSSLPDKVIISSSGSQISEKLHQNTNTLLTDTVATSEVGIPSQELSEGLSVQTITTISSSLPDKVIISSSGSQISEKLHQNTNTLLTDTAATSEVGIPSQGNTLNSQCSIDLLATFTVESPSDHEHVLVSHEESRMLKDTIDLLKLSPKVVAVFKKNYTRLCNCLPRDHMKTVDKIKQQFNCDDDFLDSIRNKANEMMICFLISRMKSDYDAMNFCNYMEILVDDEASKRVVGDVNDADNSCSSTTTALNKAKQLSFIPASKKGDDVPELVELHRTIVPVFATRWKHLGIQLKIPENKLDIIKANNPSSVTDCCTEMLRKWLQMSAKCTWTELQVAIDHLPHSLNSNNVARIKYQYPLQLPHNYVCRQHLLNDIASKLCQATLEPNYSGICLAIIGAGGFGKTNIVTALCHHSVVKEQFKNGFLFIQLGPQASDPSKKLKELYHLLTGENLQDDNVCLAAQNVYQLTVNCYHDLLVIIDDVWHVEDAEPIVKAFRNCKIVLTTRMNDIEEYIPTKHVIEIGPMEQSEAMSLLTGDLIDVKNLLQRDSHVLEQLAQDVYLWPLLLSLIRGQLQHQVKRLRSPYTRAIQNVYATLQDRGLTAFDQDNIRKGRKNAVKACIEVSFTILNNEISDKMKSLILWTGIGTALQTGVLHALWNVTENKAADIVRELWVYGLVQFNNVVLPPSNNAQCCVEVHSIISQFVVEHMDSTEVQVLSPYNILNTNIYVNKGLKFLFKQQYGIKDSEVKTAEEYLTYTQCEIEHCELPIYLQMINMLMVNDPHTLILMLSQIINTIASPTTRISQSPTALCEELLSLIAECQKTLKRAHISSRKLNQTIERCVMSKDYHKLIKTLEDYTSEYSILLIAKRAITMLNTSDLHNLFQASTKYKLQYEFLQLMTSEYHTLNLVTIPFVKLLVKELEQIERALHVGPPMTHEVYLYYISGKYHDDFELIHANRLKKFKETVPTIVKEYRLAERYETEIFCER